MKHAIPIAVAVAVASVPTAALADDVVAPPTEPRTALTEAIEVVARGYAASPDTAVPKVTVLDAADIERRQATSVADLLSEVPGALVVPDGPHGQFTRLFLRGAASNQTLVLVDGIPQNDATGGGLFDFNDLGTASVERVEVLSGSYGVLYGSEAIGGVVAVTTRDGRGPWRGMLRLEGGSFSTHREVFGAGGGDDAFSMWVTASNDGTRGERRGESYRASEIATRFGFDLTDDLRADVVLRSVDSRVESPFDFPSFGSTVLPPDDGIARERSTLSTGVTLTHEARWLTTRLSASYLRVDSDFTNDTDGPETIDPDFTPGTGDEVTVVRDELDSANWARDWRLRLAATAHVSRALGWRPRSQGGVEIDVTGGGEWLDQASDSRTTSPNFGAVGTSTTNVARSLDTTSGFVLGEARFPDAGPVRRGVFAAGVRHDHHDVFGGEGSPFVGGRFDFAPTDTTLRASWGEGFRAPKPSELDDPFVGNATLGAETSESVDVGLVQTLFGGRADVGATWFRLDTDGLIAYDPSATTPSRPFGQLVNFNSTRTTGIEFAAHADLGAGFAVRASHTHQNPRDADTGLPLPNRSRDFTSAGVSWERGAILLSLDAVFTSKLPHQGGEYTYPEPDERAAPGRRILVNLAARWRASDSVSVFARIENLFDDDWVATPTSPAGPPLGVFAGVQFDF